VKLQQLVDVDALHRNCELTLGNSLGTNIDLFGKQLLDLLEISEEKLLQKSFDDNPDCFSNELVLFVLAKIKFDPSVQSFPTSERAILLIQIYDHLL
jgi:hypothetical protein